MSARGDNAFYRMRKALWRNRLTAGAMILAVTALGAVGAPLWERQAKEEKINSLAVLPFVNLGVQSREDTLADGLTEDLITELASAPGLKVPGRTAVQRFKGKAVDVRDAGRQLGVNAVLEGSVRRTGGQVRIVAQLISVRDGFHLWAESYDRQATDPLLLEREISRRIADDLKVRVSGNTAWKKSGRTAPASEASKDYLEGHRLEAKIFRRAGRTVCPRAAAAIDAFESAIKKIRNCRRLGVAGGRFEWAIGFDESRVPSCASTAPRQRPRKRSNERPTPSLPARSG